MWRHLFHNKSLKKRCMESLRDHSPSKDVKGIVYGFLRCVDSDWINKINKGNSINYMRCKYYNCHGIIKFSRLSVVLNDLYHSNITIIESTHMKRDVTWLKVNSREICWID